MSLSRGSLVSASTLAYQFARYAWDFARVRRVRHIRRHRMRVPTGRRGSRTTYRTRNNVRDTTALANRYISGSFRSSAQNRRHRNGVTPGRVIYYNDVLRYANDIRSMISSQNQGLSFTTTTCHSSCHSNNPKGRSRR